MAEITTEMEAALDAWEAKYQPMQNPFGDKGWNGTMFETYGEDLAFVSKVPDNQVWTWVDGDEGTWIISGFHWVNRIGYFITTVPLEEEYAEIQVDVYGDSDDEEYDPYK